MKYFVRILLSIVSGVFGFGVAYMTIFGLCFAHTDSYFCSGTAGAALSSTVFVLPVIAATTTWFLVAKAQKPSAQTIAPNAASSNAPQPDFQARVRKQNTLLIYSYIAIGVGIIRLIFFGFDI